MIEFDDYRQQARAIHSVIQGIAESEPLRIGFPSATCVSPAYNALRRLGLKKPFFKSKKEWTRSAIVWHPSAYEWLWHHVELEFVIGGELHFFSGTGGRLRNNSSLGFLEDRLPAIYWNICLGEHHSEFEPLIQVAEPATERLASTDSVAAKDLQNGEIPPADTEKARHKLDLALSEVRKLMLEGIVEQNALALVDPIPAQAVKQHPEPLIDILPDEKTGISDEDIRELLIFLGETRARRVLISLDAHIPAADWAQNCLALCYGSPGSLKAAVLKRDISYVKYGFPLCDTVLLDLVGDIMGIDAAAANLHYLNMQQPARLRSAIMHFLATSAR